VHAGGRRGACGGALQWLGGEESIGQIILEERFKGNHCSICIFFRFIFLEDAQHDLEDDFAGYCCS
jgi:hypothetical protein